MIFCVTRARRQGANPKRIRAKWDLKPGAPAARFGNAETKIHGVSWAARFKTSVPAGFECAC